MAEARLILGEYSRNLDERYRLSLPTELMESRFRDHGEYVLTKERAGCVSLWDKATWTRSFEAGLAVIQAKMSSGRLEGRLSETQEFGRLLSSRHRWVQLAAKGRLLIPEGFREFLRVEPGGEVVVVGAGVCIEIWHPRAWIRYLQRKIPEFRRLFDQLSS
jgi:MraZ protein